MIKKGFYFLILICFGLLIFLLINDKKTTTKVISLTTLYSYLYHDNQKIEISLYYNNNNYPAHEEKSYLSFKIVDKNSQKSLYLDLIEITYSHVESYLNEKYFCYIYKFKMPNLSTNYYIKDAYLIIETIDNKTNKVKIGDLYLNYYNDLTLLPWQKIDSKKSDPSLPTISEITISLFDNIGTIKKVFLYDSDEKNYEYDNNTLRIKISEENLIINNVPVFVYTSTGNYYFNNHRYLIDYHLLEKAEGLVNIYEIN